MKPELVIPKRQVDTLRKLSEGEIENICEKVKKNAKVTSISGIVIMVVGLISLLTSTIFHNIPISLVTGVFLIASGFVFLLLTMIQQNRFLIIQLYLEFEKCS